MDEIIVNNIDDLLLLKKAKEQNKESLCSLSSKIDTLENEQEKGYKKFQMKLMRMMMMMRNKSKLSKWGVDITTKGIVNINHWRTTDICLKCPHSFRSLFQILQDYNMAYQTHVSYP